MEKHDRTPNALLKETSPYLLQHAWNPVNWLPWGKEALEMAQREQKLIIISIGYAACHWCHVMERECFEDEDVAVYMNRDFISIKVDREERPDIDAIYMDAVQLMRGQGGWPLNVICLPDGSPVYGGTYFPKPNWIGILKQLSEIWKYERPKAIEYAQKLREGMLGMELIEKPAEAFSPDQPWLESVLDQFRKRLDPEHGGMDKAPKFPMPVNLRFLLEAGILAQAADLTDHVHHTLRRMAHGGIYDAVGGGFARYSVDRIWLAPHFEKMLYDNAQLLGIYADAFRHRPDPLYEKVIRETVAWLDREMTAPEGLLCAALDADSEGEEGKFYTWKWDEWARVLGEDATWAAGFWSISPEGNWEHTNILYQAGTEQELAERLQLTEEAVLLKIRSVKERLLNARSQRIRPGLDHKRLLSWNALMISGYVSIWKALEEESWKKRAINLANACLDTFLVDNQWMRTSAGDTARIPALLEDHALLAEALLDLSEADPDERWIRYAQQLTQEADDHFLDPSSGLYFSAPDHASDLIMRKKELYDNVIPSSNSVMAHINHTLWTLTGVVAYRERYLAMLSAIGPEIAAVPSAYANWARLAMYEWDQPEEWIFTNALNEARLAHRTFVPGRRIWNLERTYAEIPAFSGKYQDNSTLLYRCHAGACGMPESL